MGTVEQELGNGKIIVMNEKTLKLLEFDSVRQQTAALALSEEAEKIILDDVPRRDYEDHFYIGV